MESAEVKTAIMSMIQLFEDEPETGDGNISKFLRIWCDLLYNHVGTIVDTI